jgi:HSP20 family molecular chaperone IbpA
MKKGANRMKTHHKENAFPSDEWEKWLETFFLDPFTTILDQTQFRVDIYDTNNEVIIEALLPDCTQADISVYLDIDQVVIKANSSSPKNERVRTVTFPFTIHTQKTTASYSNQILEIFISKIHQQKPQNRYITLS